MVTAVLTTKDLTTKDQTTKDQTKRAPRKVHDIRKLHDQLYFMSSYSNVRGQSIGHRPRPHLIPPKWW